MRESVKLFVKLMSELLPISEPIYEFGSLQVFGQEGFSDLRPFFSDKRYIGADFQKGPGVDAILNLHDINLPLESVGTILIIDTLEHVEYPWKAIEECDRILKPNGILIMTSVMNFKIHSYPNDYWRFTPEAFKSLLKTFPKSFVDFLGEESFPHTILGIGFKSSISENLFGILREKLLDWKKDINKKKKIQEELLEVKNELLKIKVQFLKFKRYHRHFSWIYKLLLILELNLSKLSLKMNRNLRRVKISNWKIRNILKW